MRGEVMYLWKTAPFLRLLIPLVAGICSQFEFHLPIKTIGAGLYGSIVVLFLFSFLPLTRRFQFSPFTGFTVSVIFVSLGAWLTYHKDVRNEQAWIGKQNPDSAFIVATLEEEPVLKARSYKTVALVTNRWKSNQLTSSHGRIILYFEKSQGQPPVHYGTELIFKRPLQEISRAGNAGAFDYRRYCLFQGITHQAFLNVGSYSILGEKKSWWKHRLLLIRQTILSILRKHIKGHEELGLAEALLIGYKDDLDKNLVQSYSSTGVVHIIAISGLHLGLIYWLLAYILRPLSRKKQFKWLAAFLIIAGLWTFSLLAGAQPSVLRSALMFSCVVAGTLIGRRGNIYNSLAGSAFLLLCFNPFWLWDVGFQLSYAAVLSIVIFMQPVYGLLYVKNKLIDMVWKLVAVTLSAQILTLPLTLYQFHQFPNYFLLANLIAVPLSSLILLGEIFLCAISALPALAEVTGHFLAWLIKAMNAWVGGIESLPFSTWDSIQISPLQSFALYSLIAGISYWLLKQMAAGLIFFLASLLLFLAIGAYQATLPEFQNRIIVYNISGQKAVDIVKGKHGIFLGDLQAASDTGLYNFHFRPTRLFYRYDIQDSLPGFYRAGPYIEWNQYHILALDSALNFTKSPQKAKIDLLLVSGKARISMAQFPEAMDIKQVVFDASVPTAKLTKLKKECDSLGLKYHDVRANGAFAINLR